MAKAMQRPYIRVETATCMVLAEDFAQRNGYNIWLERWTVARNKRRGTEMPDRDTSI